jgi:hypothetical protein
MYQTMMSAVFPRVGGFRGRYVTFRERRVQGRLIRVNSAFEPMTRYQKD